MSTLHRMLVPRSLIGVIGGVAVAILVAGCGGGSGNNQRASVGTKASAGTNGQPGSPGFSIAIGRVSGVGSAGATVKTSAGSKKVAFGTITTFTLTSSTTRSGVAVGDCVQVTPTGDSRSSPPSARPTASPLTRPSAPSAVKASEVTITSTSKCAAPSFKRSRSGGPPGGFTTEGGGAGTIPMPTGSPGAGGAPPNFSGGGLGVAGTVTAVTGSTITVKSQFGSGTTTVTTTASTSYSVTNSTKAASVKSGQCLLAIGDTASDGTLDAQAVSLSSPVNGSCPSRTRGLIGGFPTRGGRLGGGPATITAGGSGA